MLHEPFATGHTFIYKIDPRIRIVAVTVFTLMVALSGHFSTLLTALGISTTMILLVRPNLKTFFKRFLAVNGFLLLLWLVLPLTFQNSTLFNLGPVKVYRLGIFICAQITLKTNAIVLALISLVSTMPLSTFGSALDRLGLPNKIVHLLLMTYRYSFVIEQEYHRLLRAAQIRGFRPKSNLHTYQTYAYIVGMLFVRSSLRADHVYNAMRCRGFKQKFYCLQEFKSGKNDFLFVMIMAVFMTVLMGLEWYIQGVLG